MNAPFVIDRAQGQDLETALAQIASIASIAIGRVAAFSAPSPIGRPVLGQRSSVERARAFYAARRRRDRVFGAHADLLSDPAWDMLLDLFIAYHDGRRISITSVCGAACAAPTTALRWLKHLEERGLVDRSLDTRDARRHFVELSTAGLTLMNNALASD